MPSVPPTSIDPAFPAPAPDTEIDTNADIDAATALLVMGVSGCGKSTLAAALARQLGWPMIEGDDHHRPEARARMQQGQPLDEAERAAWLDRLAVALQQAPAGAVLACSALRLSHRERLRRARPGLRLVWLVLDAEAAQARVGARGARGGHFFPVSLVSSQFETLEPPWDEPDVLALPAGLPGATQVSRVLAHWGLPGPR